MEVAQGRVRVDPYKTTAGSREVIMSQEELTAIYNTYFKRVYKYIFYRISNHYAAEDICSQVFETVMCKYHSFSPEKSNFEVWLFAIVRNAVTDYLRLGNGNGRLCRQTKGRIAYIKQAVPSIRGSLFDDEKRIIPIPPYPFFS